MLKLNYKNEDTYYDITFKKVASNIIQLTGTFPYKTKGFFIYKDHLVLGDYSSYTTIFRVLENGVQFSNDKSTFDETSLSQPSPVQSYEPTLIELKENKRHEINSACESAIISGFDITLSSGESEHFDLNERDQLNLMRKQIEVDSGLEQIGYHGHGTGEMNRSCYSNEDMRSIIAASIRHINYHQAYCICFKAWINACLDKEELNHMSYGMDIPEEYQSAIFKEYQHHFNAASAV